MFFDIHEQRRFLRFDVDFPARIMLNPDEGSVQVLEGRVRDISDAGFRMELADTDIIVSGQHLDVVLQPPGNNEQEPVEIGATLVWLEHDTPEEGRMMIGAYLNDLLDLDLGNMDAVSAAGL